MKCGTAILELLVKAKALCQANPALARLAGCFAMMAGALHVTFKQPPR